MTVLLIQFPTDFTWTIAGPGCPATLNLKPRAGWTPAGSQSHLSMLSSCRVRPSLSVPWPPAFGRTGPDPGQALAAVLTRGALRISGTTYSKSTATLRTSPCTVTYGRLLPARFALAGLGPRRRGVEAASRSNSPTRNSPTRSNRPGRKWILASLSAVQIVRPHSV